MLSTLDRRLSLGDSDVRRAYGLSSTGDAPPASEVPAGVGAAADTQRDMALRRNVAIELYESERAYVAGLQLIDQVSGCGAWLTQHYYAPLLAALAAGQPIVSRSTVNCIFSNFVDILQLSRELLCRLEERLGDAQALLRAAHAGEDIVVAEWDPWHDALGDLLVPIAPFLKMYSLFMKNFANAMESIEEERRTNERFSRFIHDADRRVGAQQPRTLGLSLDAHLLTIVQRVPRYRLLLRSLLQATPTWHRDHAPLGETYAVVDYTAAYINEHLRQHELMLVALTLQRTLMGLREPLVVPGRRLLLYGTLLKSRRKDIQPRRVYLFSDCLVFASASSDMFAACDSDAARPTSPMRESGWTSEALTEERSSSSGGSGSAALRSSVLYLTRKLHLMDCTVIGYDDIVATPDTLPLSMSVPNLAAVPERPVPLRHHFDILSAQCSFSLYAPTRASRQKWVAAIREAQDEYRASQRSLQRTDESVRPLSLASLSSDASADDDAPEPLTRALADAPVCESYHAPVWVPDSLAARCMRCSEPFTLWRRKHHCRLCGRVFCGACSSSGFWIRHEAGDARARACVACFAATFPELAAASGSRTPPRAAEAGLPVTAKASAATTTTNAVEAKPSSPVSVSLRPTLHMVPDGLQRTPAPPALSEITNATTPTKPKLMDAPASAGSSTVKRPVSRRRWSVVTMQGGDTHLTPLTPRVEVQTSTARVQPSDMPEDGCTCVIHPASWHRDGIAVPQSYAASCLQSVLGPT